MLTSPVPTGPVMGPVKWAVSVMASWMSMPKPSDDGSTSLTRMERFISGTVTFRQSIVPFVEMPWPFIVPPKPPVVKLSFVRPSVWMSASRLAPCRR